MCQPSATVPSPLPAVWNSLPDDARASTSRPMFRRRLKIARKLTLQCIYLITNISKLSTDFDDILRKGGEWPNTEHSDFRGNPNSVSQSRASECWSRSGNFLIDTYVYTVAVLSPLYSPSGSTVVGWGEVWGLWSLPIIVTRPFLQRKQFRLFIHISSLRGLSVCRLSHSCLLLKPFDGFRCHLAGKLMKSNDTLWQMGSLTLEGRGDMG